MSAGGAGADSAGPRSRELYARATKVLPGGVNSPVRAYRAVGGTPLVMRRGSGCEIEDEDGRRYVDFVNSWGPLILGHAHPHVLAAVVEAASSGMSFGAPCAGEVLLGEKVVGLYPGLEQVRFVSSGTEAVMSAIRLARGATGRQVIVKFSGCYHGHVDSMLVAAGSGLVTFGQPASAGVPGAFAKLTRVLPLNTPEALLTYFEEEGDNVAAVIIEPVPANNGLLLQTQEFLHLLRDVTERHGALLIFDEVISGFRVAAGGAAERYQIEPDLATFGKIIGGGMPVGAFGGKRALMKNLAPEGPVYQAGTLSGNPVAMAAGRATLEVLEREDGWHRLEELGAYLERRIKPVLDSSAVPARFVRIGSIFWLSLQPSEPPRTAECIMPEAAQHYRKIFHAMLRRGYALAPSAYEVGFLSLAHTEAHIDGLVAALAESLAEAAQAD